MEFYIRRFAAQSCSVPRGTHILVALSGGRDSVCLLHCMLQLREEFSWRITAAHLDHGMRAESAADARFAEELCRAWDVPCVTERADVPGYRKAQGLSPEDAARRLRYEFLERTAQSVGADVIALAHHAGDQTETMLLHLLRGSGLVGASGMQSVRGRFIRPMLQVPTQTVQAYFEKNGLACVQDMTNFDLDNPRNRIRHRILPELEAVNPSAQAAFARAAENLREDEQALEILAAQCLKDRDKDPDGISAEIVPTPHRALLHRAIRQLCSDAGLAQDLTREHVTEIAALWEKGRGSIDLPRGYRAESYRGRLRIDRAGEALPEIAAQDGARCGHFRLCRKKLPEAPHGYREPGRFRQYFSHLPQDCVLRAPRAGDKLRMKGGSKSLGEHLSDAHVPPWQRKRVPVLAAGSDVIWVPVTGWAQAQYFVHNPVEPVEYLSLQEEE